MIFVVVRDEKTPDDLNAAIGQVLRRVARRGVTTIEQQNAPIARLGVRGEAMLDVQNLKPHVMKHSTIETTEWH